MPYAMGIDLGSTSIKAHIFDASGRQIAHSSIKTPLQKQSAGAQPAQYIWDPEEIWQCVCTVTQGALSGIQNAAEIIGVAVTGFGFDGVPLDPRGNVLYPFISWYCNRTTNIYEEISARVGFDTIFDFIGRPAFFYDTVYRLEWLRRNEPDVIERMSHWLYIEDYINYKLCGVIATDYSMAACSGVFDLKKQRWDSALMQRFGVRSDIWPDAYRSGKVLGNVTAPAALQTGLSRKTHVVLGGHDYCVASFAVGAVKPGVIMDVSGTWEMLCLGAPEFAITEKLKQSGMYIDNHVVEGSYLYMSSQVSGSMTEWFRNHLSFEEQQIAKSKESDVWNVLTERAAQSPVGANGVTFLPYFSGSNCPNIDKKALGGFLGMSNLNTKNDMIRALYEGLNYLFRHTVFELMDAASAQNAKVIVTGGAVKNEFWMQNKADVSGLTLETPTAEESTTLGAAMLVFLGLGIFSTPDDVTRAVYTPKRIYKPNRKNTARYDDYFESIYKKMLGTLREINHEIFNRFKISGK